jgi:hypothetical protein
LLATKLNKIKDMKCKCCQRENDLRLGFCFDCADIESVIKENLTMFDETIPKIDGLSDSMSKVHYIVSKFVNLQTGKNFLN